ncbi:uncharacterized protein [Phyllobates terribilis]|uniref:uncharacterized protein n=2 Tax=Phyllobates terribilis TaxID=111132 RepID=UPI003CCB613B
MFHVCSLYCYPFQMAFKSEEFVREMIDLYRSLPCLWQIKSTDYCNREKKREAYQQLISLFKRHGPNEKVDEELVKRKIQGLRTVYKKELNRVEKSKKSGTGTDEVYVPTLWYYDLLAFTRDQELPRRMVCTIRQTPEEDPDIRTDSPVEDHHWQDDDISATERGMEEASVMSRNEEPMASVNEDPMASTSEDLVPRRQRKSRKRKASLPPSPDLVSLANKILLLQTQAKRDSFATYAGERLQRLDDRQRAHAERVMFETLNKAAAGELNETSTVHTLIDPGHFQQHSWTHRPDPLHSTPVQRIRRPQSLAPPPQYPMCSDSFVSPRHGYTNTGNRYEEL